MPPNIELLAKQEIIVVCDKCPAIRYSEGYWLYEQFETTRELHHSASLFLKERKPESIQKVNYCPACFQKLLSECYARKAENERLMREQDKRRCVRIQFSNLNL